MQRWNGWGNPAMSYPLAACRTFDPQGMMNPGKLLEAEAARYARLWSQYYAPPE